MFLEARKFQSMVLASSECLERGFLSGHIMSESLCIEVE